MFKTFFNKLVSIFKYFFCRIKGKGCNKEQETEYKISRFIESDLFYINVGYFDVVFSKSENEDIILNCNRFSGPDVAQPLVNVIIDNNKNCVKDGLYKLLKEMENQVKNFDKEEALKSIVKARSQINKLADVVNTELK